MTTQHACAWCTLTFKKLEHAQRHSRTHTLDRPYVCDCGKTFARRDTLNRHARLHTRKPEAGVTTKGRRRRIKSTADDGEDINNLPIKISPKITSKPTLIEAIVIEPSSTSPPLTYFTTSIPSIDVEQTLTRPNTSDGVIGSSAEAYQAARVLSRRHSLVDMNASKITPLPIVFSNVINSERRSTNVTNYYPSVSDSSPKSDGSSSSEPDDSNDGSYVESQYPSPAFTSFSPTATLQDSMSDLEAIFANEQLHRSPALLTIPLAQSPAYEFDFINSLEGPGPKSNSAPYIQMDPIQTSSVASTSTLTQKQLLVLQHRQLTQQLSALEELERSQQDSLPTPSSTHSQTIPLPQQNFFDSYDFSTQLFHEDRRRQQQQQQMLAQQQQTMAQQQQQKLMLLHHQQHHAQQLHQQHQAQQLLQLTSMQPLTQSLSPQANDHHHHHTHSRSRSSTLPSFNVPHLLSISPDELINPPVSRSRSNTLNSTFPIVPLPSVSLPTYSYPSQSLSSAYVAASFPSLLLNQHVPTGNRLGLEASPEQILFDAYQRRKSLAIATVTSGSKASSVASSISSSSSDATTLSLETTDCSHLDFFTGNALDKMQGILDSSTALQPWSEEEKREGINWLLL